MDHTETEKRKKGVDFEAKVGPKVRSVRRSEKLRGRGNHPSMAKEAEAGQLSGRGETRASRTHACTRNHRPPSHKFSPFTSHTTTYVCTSQAG